VLKIFLNLFLIFFKFSTVQGVWFQLSVYDVRIRGVHLLPSTDYRVQDTSCNLA
jgi:hypothetical protein